MRRRAHAVPADAERLGGPPADAAPRQGVAHERDGSLRLEARQGIRDSRPGLTLTGDR
jgi:hypothetical protein